MPKLPGKKPISPEPQPQPQPEVKKNDPKAKRVVFGRVIE